MAAIELRWINGIEEEIGLAGGMQDVDGTYGIYRCCVLADPFGEAEAIGQGLVTALGWVNLGLDRSSA
jgi:hypothetical protein